MNFLPLDSLTFQLDTVYFLPPSATPAKKEPTKAPSFGNRFMSAISPFGQGVTTKVTDFFSSFWKPEVPAQKPEVVSPYSHLMCGCGYEESVEQPQERTFTQLLLPTNPCFLSGLVDRSVFPAQVAPASQPQSESQNRVPTPSPLEQITPPQQQSGAQIVEPEPTSMIEIAQHPELTQPTDREIEENDTYNPYAGVHARFEEDFDELEDPLFPHNPHAGIHARVEDDFGEFESFQLEQEESTEVLTIPSPFIVPEALSPVASETSDEGSERSPSPVPEERIVESPTEDRQPLTQTPSIVETPTHTSVVQTPMSSARKTQTTVARYGRKESTPRKASYFSSYRSVLSGSSWLL